MTRGKRILFVSPTTSSFTKPVTTALISLGAEVINFYDNIPTYSSRVMSLIKNFGIARESLRNHIQDNLNQALIKKILFLKPDYLLVIKGIDIHRKVIEEATNSGVVTINWFPDCQDIWAWIEKNATSYSYFVTCCFDFLPRLEKLGARTYYLPYAGEPDQIIIKEPKKFPIVFVGQFTKRRERYFRMIKDFGLRIWGYELWKTSKLHDCYFGQLEVNVMKTVFRQSKIVVNMTTSESDKGFIAANLRNFEVTGVGAFLLTQGNKAIDKLFTCGKEIVCFRDQEDLRKKAEYFLAHDSERETIARAGWHRVCRDHTYEKRLKELFQKIENYE